MSFLDKIVVTPLPDGKNWEIQHEIRFSTRSGHVIYIPAGFVTDFASIPWFFRRVFQPATGKYRRAALVHDWIYRTDSERFTRSEADKLFRSIMEDDGVSTFISSVLYTAVSVGGGGSFVERV